MTPPSTSALTVSSERILPRYDSALSTDSSRCLKNSRVIRVPSGLLIVAIWNWMPGHLVEIADRREQHDILALALPEKPEAILQATDRFCVADVDFLILRRDRHSRVVCAADQAAGQLDPFMRVFLPHSAEMRNGRLRAEQAIDRPLEVRSNPEWKPPLGDRDIVERRRSKVRRDQT